MCCRGGAYCWGVYRSHEWYAMTPVLVRSLVIRSSRRYRMGCANVVLVLVQGPTPSNCLVRLVLGHPGGARKPAFSGQSAIVGRETRFGCVVDRELQGPRPSDAALFVYRRSRRIAPPGTSPRGIGALRFDPRAQHPQRNAPPSAPNPPALSRSLFFSPGLVNRGVPSGELMRRIFVQSPIARRC
jgi:hypothetical protein